MLHAIIAFHEIRIQHPDEISTPMMDTRVLLLPHDRKRLDQGFVYFKN